MCGGGRDVWRGFGGMSGCVLRLWPPCRRLHHSFYSRALLWGSRSNPERRRAGGWGKACDEGTMRRLNFRPAVCQEASTPRVHNRGATTEVLARNKRRGATRGWGEGRNRRAATTLEMATPASRRALRASFPVLVECARRGKAPRRAAGARIAGVPAHPCQCPFGRHGSPCIL